MAPTRSVGRSALAMERFRVEMAKKNYDEWKRAAIAEAQKSTNARSSASSEMVPVKSSKNNIMDSTPARADAANTRSSSPTQPPLKCKWSTCAQEFVDYKALYVSSEHLQGFLNSLSMT